MIRLYFNMNWLILLLIIVLINQILGHVAMNHSAGWSHMLHNTVRKLFVNKNQNFTPAPKHIGHYVGSCVGDAECVHFVSCLAHVRLKTKKYCELIGGSKEVFVARPHR